MPECCFRSGEVDWIGVIHSIINGSSYKGMQSLPDWFSRSGEVTAYTVVAAAWGKVFNTGPDNLALILSGRVMCL